MTLTDGNDLHVAAGSEELGCQLEDFIQTALSNRLPAPLNDDVPPLESYAAEATDSPHPSGCSVPPEVTVEESLKRFALIYGTTHVWDRYTMERLKQSSFAVLVTDKVAKAWKASPQKRLIRDEDVRRLLAEAQAADEGRGGVAEALERFVYIDLSNEVWDHKYRERARIESVKHTIPDVFDFWYKHPQRLSVAPKNIGFWPGQQKDPAKYINKFYGLPLKPDFDESKCTNIRKMMWRLCNGDKKVWRWLASWMAYPLQHIGAKMDTAVLMHSDTHGSGKSFLFDRIMRPIYGEYGATLGQHQMESQYTEWMDGLVYGLFEEIFSRDKKYSQTGTIKQMITGQTVRIEKKFVSGWEQDNFCNCIFLSNEILPFPVEPSDRRFLVVWPNYKLGEELEKAVAQELDNGGVESFFGWLLSIDLGDFGPHTKPVMTEAKDRLIDFGRQSWDLFYRSWSSGELDAPYHSCLSEDLYETYLTWCAHGKYPVMTMEKFSNAISSKLDRRKGLKYDEPGCKRYKHRKGRRGTFFYFESHKPDDRSQSAWLTGCVANFRREAGLDGDQ